MNNAVAIILAETTNYKPKNSSTSNCYSIFKKIAVLCSLVNKCLECCSYKYNPTIAEL